MYTILVECMAWRWGLGHFAMTGCKHDANCWNVDRLWIRVLLNTNILDTPTTITLLLWTELTTPNQRWAKHTLSLLHCQSCQVYLPTPYHSRYPMSRQDTNIINITNVYLIQKSMVKLSPMVVPMPGESKQMKFDRWI